MADITEPKQRASRYGLMGAAFGLGFIGAPFAVGAMSLALALLLAWHFVRPAAVVSAPAHRDLGSVAVEVAAS